MLSLVVIQEMCAKMCAQVSPVGGGIGVSCSSPAQLTECQTSNSQNHCLESLPCEGGFETWPYAPLARRGARAYVAGNPLKARTPHSWAHQPYRSSSAPELSAAMRAGTSRAPSKAPTT